jgi:hypothetical protein
MLIFNEMFMVVYMHATVIALVAGFIATEVNFKRVSKDWSYE